LSPSDATWSVRNLLNPVSTRLLIHGANPFDLERILKRIEQTPLRNARQLETKWIAEWETLATAWHERSQRAASRGQRRTALGLGLQAASCRLAQFLINPGDIARRREIYQSYADAYRHAAAHFESPVLSVQIPLAEPGIGGQRSLAALLHLPPGPGPHPCTAVLAGLGSCKEEMNTLARFLVERGVAALVPDMPGSGETLFSQNVACGSAELTSAFRAVADFIEQRPELDASRCGTIGLCMGGGYAYRACHEQSRYRWCVALFPLFINLTDRGTTPQWMKSGPWFELQCGGKSESELLAEIGWRDTFTIQCPFYMVHSTHDNWMTLERARVLYEHASPHNRQLQVVEEEPAYSTGQSVTHTMPVGEQMCWVGPLVADWIAEQAKGGADAA
jgi:dienelactone hydrolase